VIVTLLLACRPDPTGRDPDPSHSGGPETHSAPSPPLPTADTGPRGPWDEPSPPECELTWVEALDPGPQVDLSRAYLYRVEGRAGEFLGAEAVAALPDADGDGAADLAVSAALWLSNDRPAEVRVFDGVGRGRLTVADARTALWLPRPERVAALRWTPLGGGQGSLVISGGGDGPAVVATLPLPVGLHRTDALPGTTVAETGSGGFTTMADHGDVDGDGVSDLVLTSRDPFTHDYRHGQGGVSVYRAPLPPALDSADAWATYEIGDIDRPSALTAGSECGSGSYDPVAVDLDGDGAAEILLSGDWMKDFPAPIDPNSFRVQGGAALFRGGTSGHHGLDGAQVVVYGTCASNLGGHQAAVGDVTGDGRPDVALGGLGTEDAGVDKGAVFVFSDLVSSVGYRSAATAELIVLGAEIGDTLTTVGHVGDLNGDGFDELLVGAPHAHGGDGRAYLFLGPRTGVVNARDADLILVGGSGDQWLGWELGSAGDVDGDGVLDVYVVSHGASWGEVNGGAVYVVSGAALLAAR
jgi:hypothetical protein